MPSKRRSKKVISYNMSRIRSAGSAIEKILGAALRGSGIRCRKQYKIFGKPDYALVDKKIALFCDSSFWHGYKFLKTNRHAFKTNKEFWIDKISQNVKRDKLVNKTLKKEGWRVLRFWDFEIKKDVKGCIRKIEEIIKK